MFVGSMNQFKNNIPVAMGAAWRYLRGKGNDSIVDKNFIDFLANGGETGYVNLQSFRDHEKKNQANDQGGQWH